MTEQIPLHFEFKGDKTFENFFSGAQREIVEHLQRAAVGSGEKQIFLWGERGLGKSHLLQACCRLAHQRQRSSFYYDLAAVPLPAPEILEGIEAFDLVCLDNLEAAAGNAAWEQALFHFYNRSREGEQRLVFSAALPPAELPVNLPDLKTRLAWGLTLHLQAYSEPDKIALLAFKARQLGFDITPQVGRFLLSRYARDLPSLWALLDELDRETLAAKHKLTVPFLKRILENKT
ncbi:MAG: DnaA regulatory inactivator Hda [Gammaproteobacteria bacterium]